MHNPRPCLLLAVVAILASATAGQSVLYQVVDPNGLGSGFVPCGDTDGDGVDDFLIAGYVASPEIRSGVDGSLLRTVGVGANFFGFAAAAGDVDADGHADVIVTDSVAGNAIVVSGDDGTTLLSVPMGLNANVFGIITSGVNGVGDVDADGHDDVGISDTLVGSGEVKVYSGATGNLLMTLTGATGTGAMYGLEIRPAGDVNADGHDDILVMSTDGGTTIHVVSGDTGSELLSYTTNLPGAPAGLPFGFIGSGSALDGGEDVDGDGVPDFAFGSSAGQAGGQFSGEVYVVSGANGQLIASFIGQPCEGIGATVSLGDVNNDGLADLAYGQFDDTGAPNDVTVVSIATGDVLGTTVGTIADSPGGYFTGDLDGDGYRDLLVGSRDTTGAHVVALSLGAALGDEADGNVLGGTFLPLEIDQSTGGSLHRVDVGMGAPVDIDVGQPPSNPVPAHFAIFGRIDVPPASEAFPIPGVGDLCLTPAPVATWAIPLFFTLASSVPGLPGGAIVEPGPAPWNVTIPGIPAAVKLTLQGVIMEAAAQPRVTNGVIIDIR